MEQLKDMLAPLTLLPPSDQILLCEGTKLEGRRTLEVYGLPSVCAVLLANHFYVQNSNTSPKAKDVFLFNRRVLDFSASLPDEVLLGNVEVQCM